MIDEFGDCAGLPVTYRGFSTCHDPLLNPERGGEWRAIGPTYIQAATREELIAAIDAWILENGQ